MTDTVPYHLNYSESLTENESKPILCQVEIVYSAPILKELIQIKSSKDSFLVLEKISDKRKLDYKEMFYILLLDQGSYCIGYSQIAVGSATGISFNRKEIFQLALCSNAAAIIIAHNHPSRKLIPSPQDLKITKKIASGCKLIEVVLLDHIIFSTGGYFSFKDGNVRF